METIVIQLPDNRTVKVTVIQIGPDRVRIGCDADRDIIVHRQEVYDLVKSRSREKPISL